VETVVKERKDERRSPAGSEEGFLSGKISNNHHLDKLLEIVEILWFELKRSSNVHIKKHVG
jgi:hypothetical protein